MYLILTLVNTNLQIKSSRRQVSTRSEPLAQSEVKIKERERTRTEQTKPVRVGEFEGED